MPEYIDDMWICHAFDEFPICPIEVVLPSGTVCELLRITPVDRFQTQYRCDMRDLLTNKMLSRTFDMYFKVLVVKSDA